MNYSCPSCQATFPGARSLAGRRVRCPQCGQIVSVGDGREAPAGRREAPPQSEGAGTVYLANAEPTTGETVILESVERPMPGKSVSIEVTDVIDQPPRRGGQPVGSNRPPGSNGPPSLELGEEPRPDPVRTKRGLEETEMDMTPMVDVTFLLLIFFMVTAAFTLQKSLEIPKPSDDQPSETVVEQDPDEQSDYVTVMVDEYNTYHVTTVDWEEEAPSEQDLHIHLRRARDGDSTGTVPTKLRVEAHGDALHEKVVAALDAGTATGFEEVQLATIEDD